VSEEQKKKQHILRLEALQLT